MREVKNIVFWLWGFCFGSSVWLAVFYSIGFVLPAMLLGLIAGIGLVTWLAINWNNE